MHIALIRLEARRRPFRFISVWVVWALLCSILYVFVLSSPTVHNVPGERPRACPLWGWCGAVVFCGCHGKGHVEDLKPSPGRARRLPISVYFGSGCMSLVGLGGLCCVC